eukprot:365889-Chlamydomonas_euryale.AAC.15
MPGCFMHMTRSAAAGMAHTRHRQARGQASVVFKQRNMMASIRTLIDLGCARQGRHAEVSTTSADDILVTS